METRDGMTVGAALRDTTAYEKWKRHSSRRSGVAILIAIAAHAAVLSYWPPLLANAPSDLAANTEAVNLNQKIDLPPPPDEIPMPARPVISTSDIPEHVTITPNSHDDLRPEIRPPVPAEVKVDSTSREAFVPRTQNPSIRNVDAVLREMRRRYPPALQSAGIGGTVWLRLKVSREGVVLEKGIRTSSGYEGLDRIALELVEVMELSPAFNRDKPVEVWVDLPLAFQAR